MDDLLPLATLTTHFLFLNQVATKLAQVTCKIHKCLVDLLHSPDKKNQHSLDVWLMDKKVNFAPLLANKGG